MPGQIPPPTGADLLRAVGLLADGPVEWGRPVPLAGPGVYTIELAGPLASAPIELTRIGKWIERVSELRLDGRRPTSKALDARMASYWLPDQVVVFVGSAAASVGGRVAALRKTPLGDRRPYSGGHWLHTLRISPGPASGSPRRMHPRSTRTRCSAHSPRASPRSSPSGPGSPSSSCRGRSSDARPASGAATGSAAPSGRTRRCRRRRARSSGIIPPAEPEPARSSVGGVRAPRAAPTRRASPATRPPSAGGRTSEKELSAEGHERLQAELDELRTERRPAAIARVATAREHGDLKENAEYHAAREELGFIEGRIQALEARLRNAVIVDSAGSATAMLGSTVVVEVEGDDERMTYQLVSSAEARPADGRLSTSSPVGQALVGRAAGEDAIVRMPSGAEVRYRVIEVR